MQIAALLSLLMLTNFDPAIPNIFKYKNSGNGRNQNKNLQTCVNVMS